MSTDAAHRSGWEISEVVFGVPLLAALALHLLSPLSLRGALPAPASIPAGILFMGAGVVLIVLARRELRNRGQPAEPGIPTTQVVATGVFSISRNPLYLGVVLLVIGLGLALDFPWAILTLPAALVACHIVLIAPEERYLAAKFGDRYRAYAASVHRWVGRAR